jgi:hypothetical protein
MGVDIARQGADQSVSRARNAGCMTLFPKKI